MTARSSPGVPSDRAQTATVGFALLVVVTVTSVAMLVSLGGGTLTDMERTAHVERAQQGMGVLDAHATRVTAGESSLWTVDLGATGAGSYRIDPGAGSVSIVHRNYTGTGVDATILEPTTLGAVVYENGPTTLAYQGGGVWRTDGSGDATMVSPPEFHYNGATLSLPVVVVHGQGAVSGRATVVVESGSGGTPVYPNTSTTYPDGTPHRNPITNGTVVVEVESAYATGWGAFFESRTSGTVTYPAPDTVRVELVGVDDLGAFEMPGEGGSVTVPGAEGGHSVTEFSITIHPDDTDAADFNNLQWSMHAETGSQQFELHLSKGTNSGCGADPLTVDATVYYSDDGGDTYHGWYSPGAYRGQCADLDGDGDEEIFVELSLVDDEDGDGVTDDPEPADPEFIYQSLTSGHLEYYNPGGAALATPTLGGHGASWEPTAPVPGDTLSGDRLLGHYFGQLPNEFALTVDDTNADSVNEGASYGVLHTTGSGKFVTYLHASENNVTVRLR